MTSIFRRINTELDNPIPKASKACSELIRCGCKRAYRELCKCTEANFSCTALCACNGNCYQDYIVKKNLTSKILSGKSYNCLAFTARQKVPRKTSGINSSNSSFLTFSPFFDIGCPVVPYIKYIGTFHWAITGEEIRISSES